MLIDLKYKYSIIVKVVLIVCHNLAKIHFSILYK